MVVLAISRNPFEQQNYHLLEVKNGTKAGGVSLLKSQGKRAKQEGMALPAMGKTKQSAVNLSLKGNYTNIK